MYAAYLARRLRSASVRRYLNIVRVMHLEAGLSNPLKDSWFISSTLKGIGRAKGTAVNRKSPITPDILLRIINGSGPAYLSELLHVYTPSRTLRFSSDTRMLEIQQYKRKTHCFRTFSCFGPHIWNSLPQHCSTLSSFKAKLRIFLFSQYFHPN